MTDKPQNRPQATHFSSGPCAKHPGWAPETALKDALTGRSHRSKPAIGKIQELVRKSRDMLGIPEDYHLAIVPGSDTGAIEMAMWSLLGARGVDVLGFDVFSNIWVNDVVKHLKISDVRVFEADFGQLPNLSDVDTDRDVVFAWNGTTAGVKIPDGDWIKPNRQGLTLCDATSAVFAMEIPWEKLDVVTWSWQKALGGEAGHGMLALSPRAVERLENHTPDWPIPKLFRLAKDGKFLENIFQGKTINTPSLLCIEDCIDALNWGERVGGLEGMMARSEANLNAAARWLEATQWAAFLAEDPATVSNTAICLKITAPWFQDLPKDAQWGFIKAIETLLENEDVAHEIANHRESPPSFRIWGGTTVETSDIEALLPWLDYAYQKLQSEYKDKAA